MWTPIPSIGEGESGDSKLHHVPPPGRVSQRRSLRFTMNHPASAGTRPAFVCSIRALFAIQ
jgi:hypothetical protein